MLHPGEQGRAEVKADPGIVVDDFTDQLFVVQDARGSIWAIALSRNPLIPVVIRIGGILPLYNFQPRIFPWRLIEMRVYADKVVNEDKGDGKTKKSASLDDN